MDKINIRRATETDRADIALCISEGFEKDFSVLCKYMKKVAKAISSGIKIDKFYVAEIENRISGVVAISDCRGRAVLTDSTSYRKYFGIVKGIIAKLVLKREFEAPLEYPVTTGYIEFVAVRKDYRKKGIATIMLKESLKLSQYHDFVLDVTDINSSAIQCYNKLGFEEFKRVEEKHSKQKGFNAKIYMRYKR